MDVSKIDINYLEIFDLSYRVAQNIFEIAPENASAKKQKKIRKWIEKSDIDGEAFPKTVLKYISKEVSDTDFIEFVKSCHDYIQLHGSWKEQLFKKFSVELSEEVQSAIWCLLEHGYYGSRLHKNGTDTLIDVEHCSAYRRTLILTNASGVPEGNFDYLSFENGSLTKKGEEYVLVGEAENWTDDTSFPFAIRFETARVEIKEFRADVETFADTPWKHLPIIASDILSKYLLPGYKSSQREEDTLPLIIEIAKLSPFELVPDEFEGNDFTHLKNCVQRLKYDKIFSLIKTLEKEYTNKKHKDKLIQKLIRKLNKQKYEPLWREIYKEIVNTQLEYPNEIETCYDSNTLTEIRSNIQKLLEQHGYIGTYPDFVKKGTMPGIHLAESYDMTYWVGMEKNVVSHIHCTEVFFNEHLMIEFLCGTALLRKNELSEDIYSCLFDAKGRRYFERVTYEHEYMEEDGTIASDNLELIVNIAVKKAELKKLTKSERKEYIGFNIPWFRIFLFIFIFMGGAFGICMTLGTMLFAVLSALICGQPQAIPSMFTDIPWWACLAFCWITFGGIMGIITVLVKRK